METILYIFIIIFNIILVKSIQTKESNYSSLTTNPNSNSNYLWQKIQYINWTGEYGHSVSLNGNFSVVGAPGYRDGFWRQYIYPYKFDGEIHHSNSIARAQNYTLFGWSVSVHLNYCITGAPGENQVWIKMWNGSFWSDDSNFTQSGGFGYSVSNYNYTFAGGTNDTDQVFVYRHNGTYWNLEETLDGDPGSGFGRSVAIFDSFIIVGSCNTGKVSFYKYNGTNWILNQNISKSGITDFGYSVSIYNYTFVVGAPQSNKAFVYRYNGMYWALEQSFNENSTQNFGISVSIYNTSIIVGDDLSNKAFAYRHNGTYWNLEKILNDSLASQFGFSVSVSDQLAIISDYSEQKVFWYQFGLITQADIFNCSYFLSGFKCYWNEVQFQSEYPFFLNYQINYGYDWIDILTPILDNGVYFQEFNSTNYANIDTQSSYSIQIRVCSNSSIDCSDPSSIFYLTPEKTSSSSSSNKTTIIIISVVVPVGVILIVVLSIILIKKRKKGIKQIIKQKEKELVETGGIEAI
ncbi:hypothetical protein M0811_11280 [Anaeramoeba ignava]|uniref:Uncharacterized protein n=1 Tax=Anaeramoeba ignava TaxID=1746090 RepID=A0A9Q0R7Z8_ANAIG|nr:hypothetical protein M0811_11280 [Anaeramoeba ignava]